MRDSARWRSAIYWLRWFAVLPAAFVAIFIFWSGLAQWTMEWPRRGFFLPALTLIVAVGWLAPKARFVVSGVSSLGFTVYAFATFLGSINSGSGSTENLTVTFVSNIAGVVIGVVIAYRLWPRKATALKTRDSQPTLSTGTNEPPSPT